jgi:serine/threonine-protein phosphatase PP1 catalytic subunit
MIDGRRLRIFQSLTKTWMVRLTESIHRIRQRGFEIEFESTLNFVIDILSLERSRGTIAGGKINSGFIELEIPDELVVVGDLHGDKSILQTILSDIDSGRFLFNPRNKMVFLGDYIDRGNDSLGVLHTLLDLKYNYPDSVILMRGNHEAPNQFPFSSHSLSFDIQTKMPDGKRLYEKIISLFELLPLVTTVRARARLVLVHGGLPIQVDQLNSGAMINEDSRSYGIVEQILWNDPKDQISGGADWEKSRRPYGFHFGEEITNKWLKIFGASVLVRGHEPCHGFNILHNDKVLTVFSCKESYPNFEPAYLCVSKRGLQSLERASDLTNFVHKL